MVGCGWRISGAVFAWRKCCPACKLLRRREEVEKKKKTIAGDRSKADDT